MTPANYRMTTDHTRSRWMILSLLVLSSVLYLGTAGSSALVDDDVDAAHALVAREMLQRHDYVVMYMDGIRYLIRPPMHFWLVAASYALLGETEFATRLPLALCVIGLVLLTFAFGRRFFGERAGYYGALAIGTSVGMFIFTRSVIPEAIYALEFTAIFYLFLRSWTGSLDPRAGYWGAAAVCALAVLTRGAIGVLFPGGAIVGFITLTRSWSRWRELRIASSAAVFLAIAAPWHILAELRAPGFFWAYFVNENINRALGTRLPHDYGAVPLWLWWIEHFAWLFPWSFFAPLLLREIPPPRTWGKQLDPDAQARLFLFVWAGVILLFFSIEDGSRMEYYSFGAWPALAMLLGLSIADAERTDDRWLQWIGRALATLGLLCSVVAGVVIRMTLRNPATGNFSSDVRTHGTEFYQSAMMHILDLTPQALADLRAPILIAAASLGAAFLAAWILRGRKLQMAATMSLAIGMVGFFFAANQANKAFDPTLSSRALAIEINKTLQPGDQIALYGDIRVAPGVAFYSQKRVLLYNATGSNLEFGSHYPDAPKTFFTDDDFRPLWDGAQRVLLVVPADKNEEAVSRLPRDSTWILTAAGGKTVYVNQQPGADPLPRASRQDEKKIATP
jgi:4-amino-4-deoxy-L-arabinose transferase-like glycosyltransferase